MLFSHGRTEVNSPGQGLAPTACRPDSDHEEIRSSLWYLRKSAACSNPSNGGGVPRIPQPAFFYFFPSCHPLFARGVRLMEGAGPLLGSQGGSRRQKVANPWLKVYCTLRTFITLPLLSFCYVLVTMYQLIQNENVILPLVETKPGITQSQGLEL